MVNDIVTTIDTNNYSAMAKAMGMSQESSSDDKPKTLPRLKLSNKSIMRVLLLVQTKC